jgi:hypothetical protein
MFKNFNLEEFMKTFNADDNTTVSPPEVQRRLAWDPRKQGQCYLNTMNRNGIWCSPIIMVDVRKCLDHCKVHETAVDVEWYQKLLEDGTLYLILDGQNRTGTLEKFYNNELAITGNWLDQDEEPVERINVFLKDMPQRLQDRFRTGSNITVAYIENASRMQLRQEFIDYNSGLALNRMEKRDCSFSGIGHWVRDQSKQHKEQIQRLFNKNKINRMADLEWIIHMAMHLMRSYESNLGRSGKYNGRKYNFADLTDHNMDEWYNIGFDYLSINDPSSPYPHAEMARLEKILGIVHTIFEKQKKYLTRSGALPLQMAWATVMTVEWLYDHDYMIRDESAFFDKLYSIDKALCGKAEVSFGNEMQKHAQNNSYPEPSKSQYYHYQANVHKSGLTRQKRFDKLLVEVKKNLNSLTLRKKWNLDKAA